MRRVWILDAVILLALAACGGDGSQAGSTTTGPGVTIHGRVTAGPTCPVVVVGQTGCDDRPVDGAVIVVRDDAGSEVSRASSDVRGRYALTATPGETVTLEPQPVEGLLGTAAPETVSVPERAGTGGLEIDFFYDTGIR